MQDRAPTGVGEWRFESFRPNMIEIEMDDVLQVSVEVRAFYRVSIGRIFYGFSFDR